MATTIDFRPNYITSWVDIFNLIEHAREIYGDIDKLIISPSQEETLVIEADRVDNLLRMELAIKEGVPMAKIHYRLGKIEGYKVEVE